MRITILSTLLLCISLQQTVWANSALEIIDENFKIINRSRKKGIQYNNKTTEAIDKIHGIVTGHSGGINYARRATSAEFEAIMSGFISEQFHRQHEKVKVPQSFYANLVESSERQYTHSSMALIAYLGAHFAARHKEVYFLTPEQCAERVYSKLQKLMRDSTMDAGLKKHLTTLKDTREHIKDKSPRGFVRTVLDHFKFHELVRRYSRGYKDVSHQWLIDAADVMRRDQSRDQQHLLQGEYRYFKKDSNIIEFAMVEDPENHLAIILTRYDIPREQTCTIGRHTFINRLDNMVQVLNSLYQAKAQHIYNEAYGTIKEQTFKLCDNSKLKFALHEIYHNEKPMGDTLRAHSQFGGLSLKRSLELNIKMLPREIQERLIQAGIYKFQSF